MLTNEKVLEVFKDFLSADDTYEVVMTSRGYTVLNGEDGQEEWYGATICPTPDKLRDALLRGYEEHLTYLAHKDDMERDLTKEEEQAIENQCCAILKKCK